MTDGVLPLFPLRAVLFPGRPLPLHIFEERYRALLADSLATDRRFGVVAIRQGLEIAGGAELFGVGTIAEIEEVEHHDDGRADIVTRGVERFAITELLGEDPYPRARVEPRPEVGLGADAPPVPCEALRSLLRPYLAGLGAPDELLTRLPRDPAELSWLTAAAVQVDLVEQQRLLEIDGVAERLAAIARIVRRETTIMEHLGTVASLNPPGPTGAELN